MRKPGPKTRDSLFEKLINTNAYAHNPETFQAKKYIVKRLAKRRAELLKLFQDPLLGDKAIGFVVEECVRFSPAIPHNSTAAEKISREILKVMETNKGLIEGIDRLANPDHILLSIKGNKATITGISETKASADAFIDKQYQILLAKKIMPEIVKRLNETKTSNPPILGKRYTFTINEPLRSILVLPQGEKERLKNIPRAQYLEIKELELTSREITFVIQEILKPDYNFRPWITFNKSQQKEYHDTVEKFIEEIMQCVKKEILDPCGVRVKKKRLKEISIFVLATEKIPFYPPERVYAKKHVKNWLPYILYKDEKNGNPYELPQNIKYFLESLYAFKNETEKQHLHTFFGKLALIARDIEKKDGMSSLPLARVGEFYFSSLKK